MEDDADDVHATVSLSLVRPSVTPCAIAYRTLDGTAKAGIDYIATNGVVWFPPGVTDRTLRVRVLGDDLFESTEIFHVVLEDAADPIFLLGQADISVINNSALLRSVISSGDLILPTSTNSPAGEGVESAIDGKHSTKYLNFDKMNSGFTVFPRLGPTVVKALSLTSANDSPERDPSEYMLEGSVDGKVFALISSGMLPIFSGRFKTHRIGFENDKSYRAYRLVFPNIADPRSANSLQISEVGLHGFVVPPDLEVSVVGGLLRVSWVDSERRYILQAMERFGATEQWLPVQGVFNNEFTVPASSDSGFFRLAR